MSTMLTLSGASVLANHGKDYSPPPALSALRAALQEQLDELSKAHPEWSLQLGWASDEGSFGLAAGTVQQPSGTGQWAWPWERSNPRPTGIYDKFLFGSGTKPLTSVAVLRLMEQGVLSLDDPVAMHVDKLLAAKNGTSMTALFGQEAANVTVGHLIRMQSGLADFDTPSLDDAILKHGDQSWPPYAILRAAGSSQPPMHFAPGSMTEYSSTNYVLAGLVLLAHDEGARGAWERLDLFGLIFPPAVRPRYANVSFIDDELISSTATVPGFSGMIKGELTTIWAQRGGVLGWTCGNMAASTLDVAQFYRDLLVTKTILQPATVELMESFNVLNYGWEKGRLWYGAGLMIEQSASAHDHTITFPPDFRQWGSYIGHGGDTYGFLSEQGIVGGLGNASFSVVANMDYETSFVQGAMACRTISTAAKVLLNIKLNITCGT